MIKFFYSTIKHNWDAAMLQSQLQLLPFAMQQKIRAYKDEKEQQHRVMGKLLLQQLLDTYNEITPFSLDDIWYDDFNKPQIKNNIRFSCSHTNGLIVCSAASNIQVGVDAEMITNIDVEAMQEYFTATEWDELGKNNFSLDYFYFLWTRKEAALKAIGKGIYEVFKNIEVLGDEFMYGEKRFYIYSIEINNAYKAALVAGEKGIIEKREI
jgi:4'-phosphopantetheinyl transferase